MVREHISKAEVPVGEGWRVQYLAVASKEGDGDQESGCGGD